MENFITEVVSNMKPPSPDARLIIFTEKDIHVSKLQVHKHLQICAEYAVQHKVYLVSGLLVHNGNLCMCLIGPEGDMLCRQAAIQLSMAFGGKLLPENVQQVVQTELGNIALCVDMDAFYPQVMRTAALKGADLVISVQHLDPVDDTPERLMCSVWNAAQTNNLYVVNLSGNACTVTCPAPLTRNKDGYLVRRTGIVPLRFGFNMRRLDEVRAQFPLLDQINTSFIRNYAEELKRW